MEPHPLGAELLKQWREARGVFQTSIADALNSLAVSKMENQKLDEAIPLYEEALAIRRRVYGDVHQVTAQALENLANAWYGKQDFARSLALLDEVRRIREALFGPASFLANRTRFNMAAVARDNKEFARAIVLIDTALVAFRKQLGDESLDVASACSLRGSCRKGLGDYAGALVDLRAALAICDKRGTPTTPVRISTLYRLTDLYAAQHDCRAVRETADLALKVLDPAKPANATWIKRFNNQLAGCR
jgi:tetratricopeptide (TPR) repeat protein